MVAYRALAYILFISAIAGLVGGIFGYLYYGTIQRSFEDAFILNTGIAGLFAVTHGILLLKIKDTESSSVAEASAVFSMAIIGSVLSPAIITRLLMGLFSSGFVSFSFYIPTLTAVTANIIIGGISIFGAIKQSRRILGNECDYVVAESVLSKSTVSKVMIVDGLITFGISTALLQERWYDYHIVAADIQAIMLFTTGIIGVVAAKKKTVNLNLWFQTFTSYTAGISGIAIVSLVQLLVHYVNEMKSPIWIRADFTVLTLCQAAFIVVGMIASFISVVVADDIKSITPNENAMPFPAKINIGLLISGLTAAGMGIFNMAIMNYPTYGLPAALISVMVFIAGRHGINIQSSNYDIMRHPYYTLNVFNSIGCCWAIGMTIAQFLTHANVQTSLVLLDNIFGYIFAAVSATSLIPAALFSIKAAIQSGKEATDFPEKQHLTA